MVPTTLRGRFLAGLGANALAVVILVLAGASVISQEQAQRVDVYRLHEAVSVAKVLDASLQSAADLEPVSFSQALVDRLVRSEANIRRVSIHAPAPAGKSPTGFWFLASSNAALVGQPSDPEDLEAFRSDRIVRRVEATHIEPSSPLTADVTYPLHDIAGRVIAVAGITLTLDVADKRDHERKRLEAWSTGVSIGAAIDAAVTTARQLTPASGIQLTLEQIQRQIPHIKAFSVHAIDSAGSGYHVVASTDRETVGAATEPELIAGLTYGEPRVAWVTLCNGTQGIDVTQRLHDSSGRPFALAHLQISVAVEDPVLVAASQSLAPETVAVTAVLALLVLGLAIWHGDRISRSLTEPLDCLREATHALAAGDLDRKITCDTTDELGELAASFNAMASSLRDSRQELLERIGQATAAREDLRRELSERRSLEEQLTQAQKMEIVGQLAGGVAHDFNNILTIIVGFTTLARQETEGNRTLCDCLDHVLSASERASTLTRDLLAFSRKQLLVPRVIDLNEVVQLTEKLVVRLVGEEIELRLEPSGAVVPVLADRGQLEQVFMNLVANARDATPSGGCITIRVDQVHLVAREDGRGTSRSGEYARLTVSDTGVGLSVELQQKVFEPFFTTKPVGKGTGLGLSMAYGIVAQHDGFLDVVSTPGEGAAFSCYLPLVAWEPDSLRDVSSVGAARGGRERILLAEDDAVVREIFQRVLAGAGYEVITAVDGSEAVLAFLREPDAYSLLLLDAVMPKKNGLEVYESLRAVRPDVRVIFASGYPSDIFGDTLGSADVEFLSKPVSPDRLLRTVREVLDALPALEGRRLARRGDRDTGGGGRRN